jgi:integrase/recombinase XerD
LEAEAVGNSAAFNRHPSQKQDRGTGTRHHARRKREGNATARGDAQARKLLEAPASNTLKGMRDRGILATLLYHGIRREELCGLRIGDVQSREGVMHFRLKGMRDKIRFVLAQAMAQRLIMDCLTMAGHGANTAAPVFRKVTNNRTGDLDRPLSPGSVHHNIVRKIWPGERHRRRSERPLRAFPARDGRHQRALA